MRVLAEREYRGYLVRLLSGRWHEIAYVVFGLRGLQAEIEFPSDWHEQRLGWIRIGLGLVKIGLAFPWPWTVPDDYQCSGPRFGFSFFMDGLHLHWGKDHGKRTDPSTVITMPWGWRHREHKVLSEPEKFSYSYLLRSGEMQVRTATITEETRLWTRPWIPYKRISRSIEVEFDAEVGERTGSWKGGVLGCGYEMRYGETRRETLRRMERERKFT